MAATTCDIGEGMVMSSNGTPSTFSLRFTLCHLEQNGVRSVIAVLGDVVEP